LGAAETVKVRTAVRDESIMSRLKQRASIRLKEIRFMGASLLVGKVIIQEKTVSVNRGGRFSALCYIQGGFIVQNDHAPRGNRSHGRRRICQKSRKDG
jgi:hypothetical protein